MAVPADPWAGALSGALSAAGQAIAGGPSSAKGEWKNSLNPILGNDFITNFGGTQAVSTGAKGAPQDNSGLSGFNLNNLIMPAFFLVGALLVLKVWKKSK